jgi:hypothetical protein
MLASDGEPMRDLRPFAGPWVAYAAALWASVFAVFHIVWAAGRYPLLDAEQARIAFAVPWKWAYDVAVAAMCVIAVPVALAPVRSWGRHAPRRLIYACVRGLSAPRTPSSGQPGPNGLSGRDGSVSLRGPGDLGALVLSRRRSVRPEHVALQTRGLFARRSDNQFLNAAFEGRRPLRLGSGIAGRPAAPDRQPAGLGRLLLQPSISLLIEALGIDHHQSRLNDSAIPYSPGEPIRETVRAMTSLREPASSVISRSRRTSPTGDAYRTSR